MNMASKTDAPITPKASKRGRSRRRRRSVNSAQRRRRWDSSNDDSDSTSNDDNSQDGSHHHGHHRRTIEPFAVTFLKVGLTLFLCSVLSYATFLRAFYMQQPGWEARASLREERVVLVPKQPQPLNEKKDKKTNFASKLLRRPLKNKKETTALTDFDATVAAMDAYGIAYKYDDIMKQQEVPQNQTVDTTSNNNTQKPQNDRSYDKMTQFTELAAQRRSQFASLVGGEKQARATLQRSLFSFLPQTKPKEKETSNYPSLALRLRDLQQQQQNGKRPIFSVVVLGSSAAAGSGNYFEQSYAFVLENLMAPLFQALNMDLQVQNLALEHTSEFPSLWCSRHYLLQQNHQKMPDLVVWDYGLTSRPEGFEAFLRNMASWKGSDGRSPFLMVRDTKIPNNNEHRDELLQSYVDHNIFVDPLLLHIDQAVAPYLTHPDENDKAIPEGFRAWTTSFGGPPGAPGKEHTHLTVKQHLMTGWLISMHMLSALTLAAMANQAGLAGETSILPPFDLRTSETINSLLPAPIVIKQKKKKSWTYDKHEELIDETPPAWLPLLIGEPEETLRKFRSGDGSKGAGQDNFIPPKELQCRTSYITPHASDSLDELIISGPVEGLWDVDSSSKNRLEQVEGLLLPKGKQFFNEGWVQDLDIATKRRKQLSKRWNFLGFQDMIKKAYTGLQSSGDLTLFVPLSDAKSRQAKVALHETGIMTARDYIETVLICEADVPRSTLPSDSDREEDGVCRLHKDTYVHVGETMALMEVIPSGVCSSCVFINVPDSANLAFKQELVKKAASGKPDRGGSQGIDDSVPGLPIRIRVRSDRGDMKVPCSVTHVLWNEAREEDSTN